MHRKEKERKTGEPVSRKRDIVTVYEERVSKTSCVVIPRSEYSFTTAIICLISCQLFKTIFSMVSDVVLKLENTKSYSVPTQTQRRHATTTFRGRPGFPCPNEVRKDNPFLFSTKAADISKATQEMALPKRRPHYLWIHIFTRHLLLRSGSCLASGSQGLRRYLE